MSTVKLSPRQADLMLLIALKRYRVERNFDMGWFQKAGITVVDTEGSDSISVGQSVDTTFRPVTVEVLTKKGLVRSVSTGPGQAILKPTRAGVEWYLATYPPATKKGR